MMGKAWSRLLLPLLLPLLALHGCMPDKEERERARWHINPDKDNKKPYGTYLAYQSLQYYFAGAAIETLPRGFRYGNIDNKMKYNYDGHSLLIMDGLDYYLSAEEWEDLKSFIKNGNEVVLFCRTLDSKIEQELGCYKDAKSEEERRFTDSVPTNENMQVLWMAGAPATRYGYKGRWLRGYFAIEADISDTADEGNSNYFSKYPDTLGYANEQPDFVRYSLGTGHLTLHAAPLALSNYFLLQDGNDKYLTAIWHTLPEKINRVYWNDYYKRTAETSSLNVLLKYPATRLALLLGVFALLIYVLFEGKRKQRVIPIIEPLRNDSVSFAETVGRLYYNKGNHSNLAWKMVQQYLEWVRTHYFLNTNMLNESFIAQLTRKSGQPETTVRHLMDMIHEIKLGTAYMDDAYLYQLYTTIQLFYKNNRP